MAALKRVLGAIIGVLSWLEDLGIFLLSLLVFLIGLYALLDSALVYRKANDSSLLVFKPDYSQSETVKAPQDMAAWLSFADVDLPVMQGEDNQEYLNKDPYGDYSLAGSLFLDARNQKDFSDPYSLIYGHHMEGNSMFGSLHNLLQDSSLSLNRFGVLWVDGIPFPLVAFAALEVDATNPYIFAPTEVGVSSILGFAKEQAVVWLPTLQGQPMDEEEEELEAEGMAEGDELEDEMLADGEAGLEDEIEDEPLGEGENTLVEEALPVLSEEALDVQALQLAWQQWRDELAAQNSAGGANPAQSAAMVKVRPKMLAALAIQDARRIGCVGETGDAGGGTTGVDAAGTGSVEAGTEAAIAGDAITEASATTETENAGQNPESLRILALSTCKYPDSVERVVVLLRILPPL